MLRNTAFILKNITFILRNKGYILRLGCIQSSFTLRSKQVMPASGGSNLPTCNLKHYFVVYKTICIFVRSINGTCFSRKGSPCGY